MTEREKFDAAMKKILSVSKAELQRRLEAEKAGKALLISKKAITNDHR
jgi:hypothetical protein